MKKNLENLACVNIHAIAIFMIGAKATEDTPSSSI